MDIKEKRDKQFQLEEQIMDIFHDFSDDSLEAMYHNLLKMHQLELEKLPFAFSNSDRIEIEERAARYKCSAAVFAEFCN